MHLCVKCVNVTTYAATVVEARTQSAYFLKQGAAIVVVQFEDGKKLDICAAIYPERSSVYFKPADGQAFDASASK